MSQNQLEEEMAQIRQSQSQKEHVIQQHREILQERKIAISRRKELVAERRHVITERRTAITASNSELQAMRHIVDADEETTLVLEVLASKRHAISEKKCVAAKLEKVICTIEDRRLSQLESTAELLRNQKVQLDLLASRIAGPASCIRGDCEEKVEPYVSMKVVEDIAQEREEDFKFLEAQIDATVESSAKVDDAFAECQASLVSDTVNLDQYYDNFIPQLASAWEHEKRALLAELKKEEDVAKEMKYHLIRGTLNKQSSTKITPKQKLLMTSIAELHEEVAAKLTEFEDTRNEIVQLEQIALRGYERLHNQRDQYTVRKNEMKGALDERKAFTLALNDEAKGWKAIRMDMEKLM